MTEKQQLKVFLLFLFLLIVSALSTASFAAVSLSPVVPGYSSGSFASAAGSFSMTAANDGFIKPAVVNVGGKAITVPATLRMAANAGNIAKTAMSLNPWAIAGTLAAGWLIDQGLEYVDGQVMKNVPITSEATGLGTCSVYNTPNVTLATCVQMAIDYKGPAYAYADTHPKSTGVGYFISFTKLDNGLYVENGANFGANVSCPAGQTLISHECIGEEAQPATPSDWDALPDPLPAVAPELPYAPYLPEGVPVDAPEYDFAPFSTPLGDPYTKPDGSTAQPMASVSPNGDSVTVDTYEQPLTDTNGDPVPSPTPQDTPEPTPDPCESHPERIGCMNVGSDSFPVPRGNVNFSFAPEASPIAGGCPAPIQVLGQTISYQPACDAMTMIRPVVIGMASIIAAYILFGAFRGVE